MRQFRITKYNPLDRDKSGAYQLDEWTEFSDVGEMVSLEEYESVESNYINALNMLLQQNNVHTLTITDLEDYQNLCPFKDGQVISNREFTVAFKGVLRSQYWCLFEAKDAYVHFGYDFYSYIGIALAPEHMLNSIKQNGLYVENCKSPFIENGT